MGPVNYLIITFLAKKWGKVEINKKILFSENNLEIRFNAKSIDKTTVCLKIDEIFIEHKFLKI